MHLWTNTHTHRRDELPVQSFLLHLLSLQEFFETVVVNSEQYHVLKKVGRGGSAQVSTCIMTENKWNNKWSISGIMNTHPFIVFTVSMNLSCGLKLCFHDAEMYRGSCIKLSLPKSGTHHSTWFIHCILFGRCIRCLIVRRTSEPSKWWTWRGRGQKWLTAIEMKSVCSNACSTVIASLKCTTSKYTAIFVILSFQCTCNYTANSWWCM